MGAKIVINGYDDTSGDMKNIFYANAPTFDITTAGPLIMSNIYVPLQSLFSGDFHIINWTYHLWEGDSSGEWYEVGSDGKKHPKKLPPWGVGITRTLSLAFNGGGTGEKLPPQVAPYIYTPTQKPHGIGKKYFGDFVDSVLADGQLNTDALGALEASAGNMMSALQPWLCVWGPIHGFQTMTGAHVARYLGTQRRRKPGVGS